MRDKLKRNVSSTVNQDELKVIKSKFIVMLAAMGVFVGAILVFRSTAWFTSNKDVSGNGMQMTAGDLPYELKTIGNNTGFQSHLIEAVDGSQKDTPKSLFEIAGITQKYKIGALSEGNGFFTNSSNAEIQWHLDETQNDKDGLGPGSEGELTFYIVPKISTSFTAKFTLNIDGYTAVQTKNENGTYHVTSLTQITDAASSTKKQALDFLNGHILFFTGRHNVGTEGKPVYRYTGLLNNNELSFSFPNNEVPIVKKDEPIEVKIYWVWANTFGQMVLDSTEINCNVPVWYDSATQSALQNYLLDNYDSVFKDMTMKQLRDKMTKSTVIDEETVYTFDAEKVKTGTNFEDLSLSYNKADQNIGTNINYMLLILSAGQ
ncbi:MAG: hypothetical protein Q4D76_00785 [Oscillospiraceae bacterium]|nr:hypothetical protein [Oscillospiraceae bacterium]